MEQPRTVRFAMLVKSAGRPHAATLWTNAPEKDPEFKKAIEENRIVTVRSPNVGTKVDRGIIGFVKGSNSSYLIFPKAISMAEGTAVIGLKFDELEELPVEDPIKVVPKRREKKVVPIKVAKQLPAPKHKDPQLAKASNVALFKVAVQFKATVTREFEVEATNASVAIEGALKMAKAKGPGKVDWEMDAVEAKILRK